MTQTVKVKKATEWSHSVWPVNTKPSGQIFLSAGSRAKNKRHGKKGSAVLYYWSDHCLTECEPIMKLSQENRLINEKQNCSH